MNRSYSISFIALVIVSALVIIQTTNAELIPQKKYAYPDNQKYEAKTVSVENLVPLSKKEKVQEDQFVKIDSLSNMFSYFYIMTNRAFVLDRTTGNYITVKRGYYNPFKPEHHIDQYSGANRSYNLLMRISEDDGATWNDEVVIYDRDELSYYSARYPSCYGFQFNGKQYVGTTFPVIDYNPNGTSTWQGFVSNLWNPDITNPVDIPINAHINIDYNGSILNWSTDSRLIVAEKKEAHGEYIFLAAGELTPADENDFANASHFGLRYAGNIEDQFVETIPDAWNSNKFSDVDQAGSRFNQMVDLRMTNDGTLYFAVYGNFKNNLAETDPNTVGVSISTDYGQTWSEFDTWTPELRNQFLADLGYSGYTFVFAYTTKGFVAFDNGDFSFVVHGGIYDADNNYIKSIIAEIYKENGQWGARVVAENTGAYIVYQDLTNTAGNRVNPSDIELQLTTTTDGQYLLAKWIDLIGYDSELGTFTTTDVFMSARQKNQPNWLPSQNVTQSDQIDRNVMIPDYIKSIKNVPMLKEYTKVYDSQFERDSQFVAQADQYLMFANAQLDYQVSVEDNTPIYELQLEVIPNPITDFIRMKVYYEGETQNAELSIYNLMGQKVATISNSNLNYGTTYFDFDPSILSSGLYFVSLKIADKNIVEKINVIK